MPVRRAKLSRPAAPGFTLVEVLVVIAIGAIISSVVLLSLNLLRDDRDLEREARRLASLIELAAMEAEMQGRDFGLEFMRGGYRFVEYDPVFDTWLELTGDDILGRRDLPEGMEFRLVVEDRAIELREEPAETGKPERQDDDERRDPRLENYAPHAMVLSSGDLSPFALTILRPADDEEQRLTVEPGGRIVVGEDDDDLG